MGASQKRKKNTKMKKKIINSNKSRRTDKNSKIEKFILKKCIDKMLNKYELDIDYMDSKYIDLELRTKEYFDDTFDIYINGLKDLLHKSSITNTEEFNYILRGYIEKWTRELSKFSEGFSIEIVSYFDMLRNYEINLQEIFNDLYYEYNDEFIVRKHMKKLFINVEERTMGRLEEYYSIYEEEYISYVTQLILSKGYLIDNTIREFLKRKNSQYEYSDNQFIEDRNSKLLYIDKYQELNKLAEKHGYFHTRDSGGHGIFTKDNIERPIVIPQGRKIARGLSIYIQKQIFGELDPIIEVEKVNSKQSKENEKLIKFQKRLNEVKNIMKNNEDERIKEMIKIADEYPDIYLLDDTANNEIMKLREEQVRNEIKPFIYSGYYKIAIEKSEEFLKQYPNSKEITRMLGPLYADSGDTSKAIEYYKKYISINGEDYDAYTNIINLLIMQGNVEEAELYTQIRKVRFSSKINILEEINEAINIGKFDHAVELINKLNKEYNLEIAGDDFVNIAQNFLLKENYKLARQYSNYVLEVFPSNHRAEQLIKVMNLLNV